MDKTEYQIINTLNNIAFFPNAAITLGNTQVNTSNAITIGVSGQLRGCWNNYLTNKARQKITNSVKLDDKGQQIRNEGQTIPNPIERLCTIIIAHFIRQST